MNPDGCHIRIGSSRESMTEKMIENLISKRFKPSLKEIKAPKQNLTFKQLKIYYEEQHINLGENFLQNLDLLTSEGELNYIAFLLADENNVPIPVVKYSGTTKKEIVENEDYGNRCLITAAYKILDKLDTENRTFTKIEYYGRKQSQENQMSESEKKYNVDSFNLDHTKVTAPFVRLALRKHNPGKLRICIKPVVPCTAFHRSGFKPCEVHVEFCKHTQAFIQHSRLIFSLEYETRHIRLYIVNESLFLVHRLNHKKTREIVRIILYVFLDYVHAIKLRIYDACNGGQRLVFFFSNELSGSGC